MGRRFVDISFIIKIYSPIYGGIEQSTYHGWRPEKPRIEFMPGQTR